MAPPVGPRETLLTSRKLSEDYFSFYEDSSGYVNSFVSTQEFVFEAQTNYLTG